MSLVQVLDSVNEDSSKLIAITLLDSSEIPAAPSTLHYRIDCGTTGQQILDWTSISTPAATNTVTITATQNAIRYFSNAKELRKVSFVAVYSSGDQLQAECQYDVYNVREPKKFDLVRGDDFHVTEGRALVFTGGPSWPVLTGATLTFSARQAKTQQAFAVASVAAADCVTTSAGGQVVVSINLPSGTTQAKPEGAYDWDLEATLATTGRKVSLAWGQLLLRKDITS